jgi:hypothetical protein
MLQTPPDKENGEDEADVQYILLLWFRIFVVFIEHW